MEYTCKMIFQALLWLTLAATCHSNPQRFRIPEVNFSPPEEVNSLERESPIVGRSIQSPAPSNNIEDTIKEVEGIIKANPELPRLTRGEIIDLLENITSLDAENAKLFKRRDPKALMVVMPYTPAQDGQNIQDLYTKAPVTQIIGDKNESKHSRRRPQVSYSSDEDNNITPKLSNDIQKEAATTARPDRRTTRNSNRRRRPLSTATTVKTAPTTYRPRTRRPIRQRSTTTTVATTELPSSKHPNHKYPDEEVEVTTRRGSFVPSDGIRIVDSPRFRLTAPSREDMDLDETRQDAVLSQEVQIEPQRFVYNTPETTRRPLTRPTPPKAIIDDFKLPDNLKSFVKDLNLEAPQTSLPEEEKKSIKDMLASIGAIEASSTTSTTSTIVPDVEQVAESLTPEMRDLLRSFGLLPDPNAKPPSTSNDKYIPDKAEVKPESYVGFKPLPEDESSRDDMDALLASFGLGRNARRQKSIRNRGEKQINFDVVPDHLKPIIDQIGLRQQPSKRTRTSDRTTEKQHVFNPDEQSNTEEELNKLDKLLGMIKQLEKLNGSATDDDLKKIDMDSLKELVGSLNGGAPLVTLDQKNAPDPNQFDVGLVKNEVKRQQPITTTTSEKGPSIVDLEASFGGQTEASTTTEAIPETTTRTNGFYYLVDWNSFLDIDDQKGKRVNLRFQPKVGDPKRFLSVTVP